MTSRSSGGDQTAATVVIPTEGRPALLRACLESLGRCEPPADQIIVVDQSRDSATAEVVHEFADRNVTLIKDRGRGAARAMNAGIKASSTELVLITHDDCTVARDWVGAARLDMADCPRGIVTGRVLPTGDPRRVPTYITAREPRDYTGTLSRGVLYPPNMACSRDALLEVGGFDERIELAEDNDLCYRWLREGRALRYQPSLTVWHHDWRSPQQLRAHYRGYARGEGMFYAKHLRQGDVTVLRYVGHDLLDGCLGLLAALFLRSFRWWDWRLGVLFGLPRGLARGWITFRPSRRKLG